MIQFSKTMMVPCVDVLCNQTALDFVYNIAKVDTPAPAEKEESELIVNDQEEDNDDDFPTIVAMNTVRAKCLQKLAYQLKWDNVGTVM